MAKFALRPEEVWYEMKASRTPSCPGVLVPESARNHRRTGTLAPAWGAVLNVWPSWEVPMESAGLFSWIL